MAAPVIEQVQQSSNDTNTTSHDLKVPVSMTNDNLLLMIFAHDDSESSDFVWPASGAQYNEFGLFKPGVVGLEFGWRVIDGSEADFNITSSVEQSAHWGLEISGAIDPDTQAPEVSTGASGDSAAADSDSITPTGGSKDYLMISVAVLNNGDATFTVYPTNCPDTQNTYNTGGGNGIAAAFCSDGVTGASFDPDAYTNSSNNWAALTIAIHPPAAGGDKPGFPISLFSHAQRQSPLLRM